MYAFPAALCSSIACDKSLRYMRNVVCVLLWQHAQTQLCSGDRYTVNTIFRCFCSADLCRGTKYFSHETGGLTVMTPSVPVTALTRNDDNDDSISAAVTRTPLKLPAVHTYYAADRICVIRWHSGRCRGSPRVAIIIDLLLYWSQEPRSSCDRAAVVYERQVPHMQHTALILRRAIEYPPIIEHAAATCDQNKRYNIYTLASISLLP